MAEVSGLDMVREIIGQINNLRRLVTINGKKFKWDGKKYVRAVDGKKFTKKELVSYVKDEKFEAPKVPDPKKVERNKSLKTKIKDKAKSVTSNIKNTKPQYNKDAINRPLANLKLRIGKPNLANLNPKGTNPTQITNRALQINKSLNPKSIAGGVKALGGGLLQNAKGLGIGMGLDWAAQSLLDRTMRNMEGKQKMHINDYRALKDKRFQDLQSRSTWWGGVKKNPNMETNPHIQPTVTRDRRGKVTSTKQPVGRNWQNPYMGPDEPKVSYESEKVVTPPNQGTDSTKKETVDKVKVKKVKFNPNVPDMGYDTTKTKKKKKDKDKVLMIGDKKASSIQKKLLKAGFTADELKTLVDAYDEKYRSKRGW